MATFLVTVEQDLTKKGKLLLEAEDIDEARDAAFGLLIEDDESIRWGPPDVHGDCRIQDIYPLHMTHAD